MQEQAQNARPRQLIRKTDSFCPECYDVIPAMLFYDGDAVIMAKECSEHGTTVSVVERDRQWFDFCQLENCNNIYNGYLVDVTNRCNIKCKYCYHDNSGEQLSSGSILNNILEHQMLAPIILTGGEPTLHEELGKIIKLMPTICTPWILTNGIKLCQEDYLDSLIAAGLQDHGFVRIGLSFHPESDGKDREFLDLCRAKKIRIGTCFYVIDSIDQISAALDVYDKYRDVLCEMRIKAASNLWNTSCAEKHVFVSDMIKYLEKEGTLKITTDTCYNKNSYANVQLDNLTLKLISWYDVYNIDLRDISCPPYYRAMDGKLYNLVTACIMNEKIKKGSVMDVDFNALRGMPEDGMWGRAIKP